MNLTPLEPVLNEHFGEVKTPKRNHFERDVEETLHTQSTKDMKIYSLEEVKDELLGKVGTPERDEHEHKVEEALHAYRIGEAIKAERLKQNLTQEELGKKVGVQKAQISRMERGYSISIPTMSRVFKALGIATATLDLGGGGKIALW